MSAPSENTQSPVVWGEDGTPRSRLFGDIYFAADVDGLAESRTVFLDGCGLPQAWAGRTHFTVAELGFGTGLNICALLDLWRRTSAPDAHLSIFSVEAYPLPVADAARALCAWPGIEDVAGVLLARWPSAARGFQRVRLPEFRATLDLATLEVAEALGAWTGRADAWFLDGFAPSTNGGMWRDEVLALVAARSAPGARLATFTVAGAVRRGLAEHGFAVEKRPGHGRKRERLEGRLAGASLESAPPHRIAVLGAGVAGCALYRALTMHGAEAIIIDRGGLGAGASGNAAALVLPGLDASGGPVARFYAQAFADAVSLYEQTAPQAVIARGVARLEAGPRDPRRFDQIAEQDIFAPGRIEHAPAGALSIRAGETAPAGLLFADGLVIEPHCALSAWAAAPIAGEVEAIARSDAGWRLSLTDGEALEVDTVAITAGWGAAGLLPGLVLSPVRGQVSLAASDDRPQPFVFGAYAVPTREGVLFGATHDRGRTDLDFDPGDHVRNLAAVAKVLPILADNLSKGPLEGRVGIRATTPDHLPLAGLDPDTGLFVLTGLGSRGFTTAPLLAEHVAALILDRPSPLPAHLAALVEPGRRTTERP